MFIFSSDWHLSNKYPLRTVSIINFMNYIEEYMKQNKTRNFIFGGDLIDHNNKIDYKVFAPVFHKFYEWKKKGINNYFIVGNHDQISNTESLLEILDPLGRVINSPTVVSIDDYDYDLVPYTNEKDDLPNFSKVLVSHLDCNSFYFNGVKQCSGTPFDLETFEHYNLVLLGHFHKKQQKGNVIYSGIPFQQNYNEEGQKTYFAVVDEGECKLIEYIGPQYMTIKIEDALTDIDYTNKYVKVQISSKVENFVKLKSLMYQKGAIEVIPEFIREEKPQDEAIHAVNVVNDSVIVSATKYIKGVSADGIDNKKLDKIFGEILKELK